jgi:exopolyphosphatase/guanosine-5'-triphosphate,3'-diphosphate pyrophosphatase
MRTAIIDMGTNTFNLLIGESNGSGLNILYNNRKPVKLGEGSINKGEIGQAAIERALQALILFKQEAEAYKVSQIKAFGTSAIRTANNQKAFLQQIENETGIVVQVIEGDEEARLICHGVQKAVPFENRRGLIIDIGGGSNELIICDAQTIYWKRSYPLGMARLLGMFGSTDPAGATQIRDIEAYLSDHLDGLKEALNRYQPEVIIGASGAFETFVLVIHCSLHHQPCPETLPAWVRLNTEEFDTVHRMLLQSTTAERLKMPGMEAMRADMIVLATIFVNFIRNFSGIKQMEYSDFSLKEGALANEV